MHGDEITIFFISDSNDMTKYKFGLDYRSVKEECLW